MEYKIKNNKHDISKCKVGTYLVDEFEELYLIIEDSERGLALLNLTTHQIATDFYDGNESFLKWTTVNDMNIVRQTKDAEFEVI